MKKISWTKLVLELIVVFLGVSAGFLLQNRKEASSNREMEQQYLQGFLTDVNANIIDLEEAILGDSLWIENNKYALNLIVKDSLSIDSANALMIRMSYFSEFSGHVNTYANITNSGNLNLITNYDLKQTIVEYHKSLEDFKLLETYFRAHISDNFMPFLTEYFDMISQTFVEPGIWKSHYFTNIFAIHYSLTQQRLTGYKRLLNESEAFKAQLK